MEEKEVNSSMHWLGVAAIGLLVGFLAGLFGKGGSAIATPLLHAVGVPAIVAVASPLPATIPSTAGAGAAYWRSQLLHKHVLSPIWSFGGQGPLPGGLPTHLLH